MPQFEIPALPPEDSRWLSVEHRRRFALALRILRSEISRPTHFVSGFVVRALRNLRQLRIATHLGRTCPWSGSALWPKDGTFGLPLCPLPQQILFRKAPPASRQKRSCGLGSLTVAEYQAGTSFNPGYEV